MKTHWLYEDTEEQVGGATKMALSQDQDTEITLGTGRMLALFCALVALCAVCFGLGYAMGRNSFKPDVVQAATTDGAAGKPSNAKTKPAKATETGLTFFDTVKQNEGDPQANPAPGSDAQASKPAADSRSDATNATQQSPQLTGVLAASGYMVQVAAVSKKEDAEALVAALEKKNYVVVVTNNEPYDQLFHVQVGPFGDIKDAETVRAKLVGDGYNPILKK